MDHLADKSYIYRPIVIGALTALMLMGIFLLSKNNFVGAIGIFLLPIIFLFVAAVFKDPRLALLVIFIINYFALGLVRYVPAPWGLSIDALLWLTWIALFLKAFKERIPIEKAKNDLVFLAAIWYGYIVFQLVNPETVSREAWFYAMRGVGLYKFLIVPLAFILLDHPKYLKLLLRMWLGFTVLAVMKGIMQKYMGFDSFEQRWLDGGGALTHIILSGVRYFSFFSDAGNYGASMGFSGVVFSIIALHSKSLKTKIIYGTVAMMAFYGMLISGTRGAMAVPAMGYFLYTILSKRATIFVPGISFMLGAYIFLKFTTIGQDNYEIRRARTALDPNDASFQVRRDNQKKLAVYLASRPFGGGIGAAGNWGQRFTPHTFLANVATDSWYVMIWAEMGVIGLLLHIFILLYIVVKSAWIVMAKLQYPGLIAPLIALLSGTFGIMIASYGNGVLGQMPNGIIIYLGMAFTFMSPQWEKEGKVIDI